MKTRIITGLVAGTLMIIVLLLPPIVSYFAFAIISAIAVWEMLTVLSLRSSKVVVAACMCFAFGLPFFGLFDDNPLVAGAGLAVFLLVLIVNQLRCHERYSIKDTGAAFFVTVLPALGISSVVYCRMVNDYGLFNLFLILFIAWMTDIGAYFAGSFFGKHKLCPKISPKKTVEGFIGGWIFSVGMTMAYTYAWDLWLLPETVTPVYWQIALLAFALSPVSVAGDLFASTIKRQTGAKDFGNIMPGHGGMMDRFDSLLFVAPLVYLILRFTDLMQVVL